MPVNTFTDTIATTITGPVQIQSDVRETAAATLGVSGLVTAATGINVTAGGVSVTAGGITVTAGGVSVTAGNLTVQASGIVNSGLTVSGGATLNGGQTLNGGCTVSGGATIDQLGGGMSATAVAITAAGTVATNVRHSRVSPAGAVTSCVMAPGTFNGQTVIVDNRNTTAANAVSFAITSGAANILNAASTVIISGMTTKQFVWDGTFWSF